MRKDSLRVLCISPLFVPTANSEAFCGAKVVLELLKQGTDVTVLTLEPDPGWERNLDGSDLWRDLEPAVVRIPSPPRKNIPDSLLAGIRFRTTIYARWIREVVRQAKALHQQKPFDLVYSRSLPMLSHIAGYWTAKLLGIPWMANVNDPWDLHLFPGSTKIERTLPYRLMSNYWMRKTFLSASLVTYPSTRLGDYHYRINGFRHKSATVPHVGYAKAIKAGSSALRFVHAGVFDLSAHKRTTIGLLRGLNLFLSRHPEARNVVEMLFVGPEDNKTQATLEELGLESIVKCTGRVSYECSLEHIASASVCILIEADVPEGIFLPSKFADYMSAGKPVLALSPRVGVVADMARDKGIFRIDANDEVSIGNAMAKFYRAFSTGSMDTLIPSDETISRFSPEVVRGLLDKCFEAVLNSKNRIRAEGVDNCNGAVITDNA